MSMAQGEFTKEEAKNAEEALSELFNALPQRRKSEYLGHLNDISLFINAAAKAAPEKSQ